MEWLLPRIYRMVEKEEHMSVISGGSHPAKEVCEILGISTKNVQGLYINISPKEIVSVYIKRYVERDELHKIAEVVKKSPYEITEDEF